RGSSSSRARTAETPGQSFRRLTLTGRSLLGDPVSRRPRELIASLDREIARHRDELVRSTLGWLAPRASATASETPQRSRRSAKSRGILADTPERTRNSGHGLGIPGNARLFARTAAVFRISRRFPEI